MQCGWVQHVVRAGAGKCYAWYTTVL